MFGEVLFDVFDDDEEVLGGAPLNVAWHLRGFGHDPLLISACGDDARGVRVLDALRRHGLDTGGVQRLDDRPTGVVRAQVDGADVQYDIVEDVAYDHVDADTAVRAVEGLEASCLVHGSLALRAESSARAFDALRVALGAPTFYDVNLRPPHTPLDRVRSLLERTTWAKMNGEELAQLTDRPVEFPDDAAMAGRALVTAHDLQALVITLGDVGACLVPRDGEPAFAPAPVLKSVVDPVGAGDAFGAVAVVGLLEGWDANTLLTRANAFAAELCRVRGATPADVTTYTRVTTAWEDASDA